MAEVVNRVLGDLTLEQAAIRCDYNPGKEGIRTLKMGKVGWESTVRGFAAGMWTRFCVEYGEDIKASFGECNEETVSDWFAEHCGFGRRYTTKPPRVDYEPNLDLLDLRSFRGLEGLSPGDIEVVRETTQAQINAIRRQKGLDEPGDE